MDSTNYLHKIITRFRILNHFRLLIKTTMKWRKVSLEEFSCMYNELHKVIYDDVDITFKVTYFKEIQYGMVKLVT